jgi:hypothetical protein
VVITRARAEYNVVAGVLPPGEIQYPLAAITSIISLQVMAVPASASTFAAASRVLSFLSAPEMVSDFLTFR